MTDDRKTGAPHGPGLERLNDLPTDRAEDDLLACCGSTAWARRMAEARPFASVDALHEESERVWWSLGPSDWLEAFRAHPRIGERKPATARGAAETSAAEESAAEGNAARRGATWSEEEQAGAQAAERATLERLARGNREYEDKFGHVFLICATGRTADEMLASLLDRMEHDPETELRVAAAEQSKITHLRLEKLLSP